LSTAVSFSQTLFAAAPLVRGAIGFGMGALIGSFLAVVLLRWPRGESALRGRSRCDGCGEALRGRELVPILSHLALRGRCRRCDAAIDPGHLLIEFAAAIIGLVALLAHPGPAGILTALLGWWLLLAAALDARHHWLPDALTLPLAPAGLAAAALGFGPSFEQRLIGAAAGFLILWAIAVAYRRLRGREGLGGGDPKLLAGLGAWLGWQQLPFVLVGSGLLGLAALLHARSRGAAISATDRLPLGTLMALSAWPIWLLIVA
jgi:leader peptidase (prepilin peptidase)/N-methyltransferase